MSRKDTPARYMQSFSYIRLGRYAEAAEGYKKSLELNPVSASEMSRDDRFRTPDNNFDRGRNIFG